MRFLECETCGGHAVALRGVMGRPACIDCLEREGPRHRYVCSVAGCRNRPGYLSIVENDEPSTVLVCRKHFEELGDLLVSYMPVPSWLSDDDDIHLDRDGVVFEFETEPP